MNIFQEPDIELPEVRYTLQETILTEQKLRDLCRWWQGVLGLSDWYIIVKIKRFYDMPHDTQGACNWTFSRREALIKILDPNDYDPNCIVPQDMELTLVHELLHIRHAPYEPGENANGWLHDQALEDTARALVAFKRNCQKT